MKLTIEIKDAHFILRDEDLLLFNGRLRDRHSLSYLDRDKYEQAHAEEWAKLDEDTKFNLVQDYVVNWLTAVSAGQLVDIGPVTYEDTKETDK